MSMQMTSVNPPTTSRVPADAARTVVDLAAIAHKVRVLRDHAGSAEVMAVVKADAYGHGAARVAAVAIEAGAAELGVATIDEALGLRAAASQRRCWRGCMPRASTSHPLSRPTSKSGCRRNTRSSPCWMRCDARAARQT